MQGHEAILQRFYPVNLVLVEPDDDALLLEVHIVGPRSHIVQRASKALLSALDPWTMQ